MKVTDKRLTSTTLYDRIDKYLVMSRFLYKSKENSSVTVLYGRTMNKDIFTKIFLNLSTSASCDFVYRRFTETIL